MFGPTFLEKASRKLEVDKALARVSYSSQGAQGSRKPSFEEDPKDLHHFYRKAPQHSTAARETTPPEAVQSAPETVPEAIQPSQETPHSQIPLPSVTTPLLSHPHWNSVDTSLPLAGRVAH